MGFAEGLQTKAPYLLAHFYLVFLTSFLSFVLFFLCPTTPFLMLQIHIFANTH